MKLNTHLQLLPRLSGAIRLLPLYGFITWTVEGSHHKEQVTKYQLFFVLRESNFNTQSGYIDWNLLRFPPRKFRLVFKNVT
jgi:hypothetical protein